MLQGPYSINNTVADAKKRIENILRTASHVPRTRLHSGLAYGHGDVRIWSDNTKKPYSPGSGPDHRSVMMRSWTAECASQGVRLQTGLGSQMLISWWLHADLMTTIMLYRGGGARRSHHDNSILTATGLRRRTANTS
jgi:hypothetical protein